MQQSAPEEFGAYIGIDWADQTHFVSLRDANSQEVKRYKLEQKPEVLSQWVNELQQQFPGQRVAVALEQTRGALIYALMSYEFFVLFPVNPKALARYREAFNVGGAKDDPSDSDLLLELVTLHRSKLRAWRPDDELTRTITLLVQYRRDLVDTRTALTHRLAALLKLYFPQALQWAGDLDTFQACDFLQRWPTLAKVQKTSATKLRQFYVSHNCRNVAVIEKRLQQIPTAQPLTTDGAVITTSVAMVQAIVSQLRPLMVSIKELDKQIAELFAKHEDYELFSSFPGAGEVLAPRLLSAFGADRDRFASAEEMQQLSGIAPVMERSGKIVGFIIGLLVRNFSVRVFTNLRLSLSASRYGRARTTSAGENGAMAIRLLSAAWPLDGSALSIAVGKCVFPTTNKPIKKLYGVVVHR